MTVCVTIGAGSGAGAGAGAGGGTGAEGGTRGRSPSISACRLQDTHPVIWAFTDRLHTVQYIIDRCNFSKSIGGQRVKSAQGTIKTLLKSDFSSDLTHFLAIIGGPGPPKEI